MYMIFCLLSTPFQWLKRHINTVYESANVLGSYIYVSVNGQT